MKTAATVNGNGMVLIKAMNLSLRVLLPLLLLMQFVSRGTSEVYTSSVKMAELAAFEDKLLKVVTSWGKKDDSLQKFTKSRQEVREIWSRETSGHPNAVYFLIKAFLHHWLPFIHRHPELQKELAGYKAERPTQSDLHGTMAAILRLQRVYDLPVNQMYTGNYSGYVGPALSPLDAYEIGKEAFTDGTMVQSEQWLRLAVNGMEKTTASVPGPHIGLLPVSTAYSATQTAAALALLGRVYIFEGRGRLAGELYRQSVALNPNQADAIRLAVELQTTQGPKEIREKESFEPKMNHLCSRPKNHTVKQLKPYHVCRFKPSLYLPYVLYKEEILAVQPYVSLFHDFIHEAEIEFMINWSQDKLVRAGVEFGKKVHVRTSALTLFWDLQHPMAAGLSARVKDATWLEVEQTRGVPVSAEAFQVVNYGLGGHYNAHFDTLESPEAGFIKDAGTRIATFLLYLTDVDMGGYTVFVDAEISVAPVKGMVLFWYNVDPAQEQEPLTLHAGCPVIKGHKWIANKWIWTHGNTYRRPCGPSPDSSQLEVENITKSRRRHFPVTN